MIRLTRPATIPPILADRGEAATAAAINAIREGSEHEFDRSIWGDESVKEVLRRMHHDKCAFCESKLGHSQPGDVEHFRPKGAIAEDPKHPGYYWLAYEWENLLLACAVCNRSGKKTRFPVAGTRATTPGDLLSAERALLLDPASEDPRDHITFRAHQAFHKTPRGQETIRIADLNRTALSDRRRASLDTVTAMLEAASVGCSAARDWIALRGENDEYSAMIRCALF